MDQTLVVLCPGNLSMNQRSHVHCHSAPISFDRDGMKAFGCSFSQGVVRGVFCQTMKCHCRCLYYVAPWVLHSPDDALWILRTRCLASMSWKKAMRRYQKFDLQCQSLFLVHRGRQVGQRSRFRPLDQESHSRSSLSLPGPILLNWEAHHHHLRESHRCLHHCRSYHSHSGRIIWQYSAWLGLTCAYPSIQ